MIIWITILRFRPATVWIGTENDYGADRHPNGELGAWLAGICLAEDA